MSEKRVVVTGRQTGKTAQLLQAAYDENAALRATLKAARMAEEVWEKTMMEVIGEDGPASVADAIRKLQDQAARASDPGSQPVPEGYVLAPKSMCITQEDVGFIAMMTGWGDEDQSDAEGVLWFGLIEDDDGNRTHGLNISCSECMEEGAIQLVQFDEPSATPEAEWVKCADRLPTEDEEVVWVDQVGFPKPVLLDVNWLDMAIEQRAVRHWKPTGLKRPNPPTAQEGER